MSDWLYFVPDYNKLVKIKMFDDGNEKYQYFINKWTVCGKWKGKVKLININKITTVTSISSWKIINTI